MKLFIFALLVVCALASFEAEVRFIQYIQKYNKQYATSEETMRRFINFRNNFEEVQQLNAESKLAQFDLNEFADLSKEEFNAQKKGFIMPPQSWIKSLKVGVPTIDAVGDIDWSTKGAVTAVKDQGQCGSCWAFSSTGAIEGQFFLSKGQLVSMSESNLVDCSHDCWDWPGHGRACNGGCGGGLQPCAFLYVKAHGIDSEASYPYHPVAGTCKFNPANVVTKVSGWEFVAQNEDQIAAYLTQHGPLAIAVDASRWSSYKGGIYDVSCSGQLDHAVLLVGYGSQGSTQYWKVKNSWGTNWGESGYIRLKKGVNECRVREFVLRPTL